MLSVNAFYAQSRWGTQWGVVDAAHPRGHRGHDIKCGAHAEIPALRGGTVVKNGYSSILGYWSVLIKDNYVYDYYCHMVNGSQSNPGVWVPQGARVGVSAAAGDKPGSAWLGPHLHYGSGPNENSIFTDPTYNATKIVTDVLASTAGGGTTPIPNKRKNSMSTLYYNAGIKTWALAGDSPGTPANWLETQGQTTADQWADGHGSSVVLGDGSWAAFKAAYLKPLNTSASVTVPPITIPPIEYTGPTAKEIAEAIVAEYKLPGN